MKKIVQEYLKQLKKDHWHVMFDDDGDLIVCDKYIKGSPMIFTKKADVMSLCMFILSKELKKTLNEVKKMIKEEL